MHANPRCAGFTVLELMIVAAIMVVVMGAMVMLLTSSSRSFDYQLTLNRVLARGSQALNRVTEELVAMDQATLTPLVLANATSISFQNVTGYDGAANELGPARTIEFQLADGETDDDTDENGDGRADEGMLVLVEGGTTTVLARDLLGARFNATGTGLRLELEVAIVDRDEDLVERTFTRRWAFRN